MAAVAVAAKLITKRRSASVKAALEEDSKDNAPIAWFSRIRGATITDCTGLVLELLSAVG